MRSFHRLRYALRLSAGSGQQRLPHFVDDVGTQTIDAEVAQAARIVGQIDSPDDHAAACRMDRVDQRGVDHIAMRPEIAGTRSSQRVGGIDQIRIGENSDRSQARQFMHSARNPVVEAVHSQHALGVTRETLAHGALDAPRFHFDVGGDRRSRRIQHRVERRDVFPSRSDGCLSQRRPVQRCDHGPRQRARHSRQNRIVVHDNNPIPRTMNIQLPAGRTGRDGGEEPGQGILAVPARHAAVGDQLGQRTTVRHGQGGETLNSESSGSSDLNIAGRPASAYQTDMPEAPRAGDDAEIDRALIARWNGGDERAATALVERHATSLVRFVGSLGASVAPEEIVQDTFVRAFGSIDSFRGESSLRSWLFTIARRLVLDLRRSARHERNHVALEDAQDQLVSADDVLDGVVADESERRVREAVERLSPMQREVFTLRVVEGLSYKEIATVASTTEGAARVHYHNAMRAVKEFLDA